MKYVCYLALGCGLMWVAPPLGAFEINTKRNPDQREWQYFLRNGLELQKNIWEERQRQGVTFADWSWSWRILWLKSCGLSNASHCITVMAAGLDDVALVVRAEAITQLGLRYQNSRDNRVLEKLRQAFRDPRNFRNGKPMFIHKNILRALQRVGGKRSETLRLALANEYGLATQ